MKRGQQVLMLEQGGRGGVADYSEALVDALAGEGCEVHLATATDHVVRPAASVRVLPIFRYLRERGSLTRVLRRMGLSKPVNGLAYLAAVGRLLPLARRLGLVHNQGSEFPPLTVLALVAFRAVGAAIVHTPHNTFDRGRSLRRSRALVNRLAARIIVHAAADLPNLAARERARAVVIPHGTYGVLSAKAAPAERSAARRALGLAADVPVTLVFGQLRPDKGLGDVLEAARSLPELRVLVAGEENGALRAEQARLTELDGRVLIRRGFQSLDDAAVLFSAADTVALPYRQASMSGVLLLAYGFARPPIVYPVGGLPEAVVDGETGWVCASPDPTALAATLREAAAGGWPECERRGRAGARLAAERFSWTTIAQQTLDVYREATARAG